MKTKGPLFFAFLGSTILGTSLAFAGATRAHEGTEDDAALISRAKISLTQAIAAAEGHVQGKAVHAELESKNGTAVYGVEVARGTQSTDVEVDARDGRIISAQADKPDPEEGNRAGRGRDDD